MSESSATTKVSTVDTDKKKQDKKKQDKKQKMFSCSFCPKHFSRPSQLKLHNYTHTGEKPFECFNCSKCFSVESNLRRHMKTHSDSHNKVVLSAENRRRCVRRSMRTSNLDQEQHTYTAPLKLPNFDNQPSSYKVILPTMHNK